MHLRLYTKLVTAACSRADTLTRHVCMCFSQMGTRWGPKNPTFWRHCYNHRVNSDILGEVRAICSIVIKKLMEQIVFSIYSSLKILFITIFPRSRLESMFHYNHIRNIIFHIFIDKFHEQIQWTGAAGYIKFLFFCLIINFLCENDASINGKHNKGYFHLLLTILINKCIKRSLFGRKNSFFFVKSSIIYQK